MIFNIGKFFFPLKNVFWFALVVSGSLILVLNFVEYEEKTTFDVSQDLNQEPKSLTTFELGKRNLHTKPQFQETPRLASSTLSQTFHEQLKRGERIRKVCAKYKSNATNLDDPKMTYSAFPSYFSQSITPGSFLVDHTKTKTVYCFNFKSAASSWLSVFSQLYSGLQIDDYHYKIIYKMVAKDEKEVVQISESRDYFKFLVVRHPLVRVLSAYRDRLLNGCTDQSKKTVPKIFSRNNDPIVKYGTSALFDRNTECIKVFPSFFQFVKFLVDNPESMDEHWMPYYKHCSPCLVEFDAVVKLETSADDEEYVFSKTKLNRFAKFRLENPTKGGRTEEKIEYFYSTIPCQILDKLVLLYGMDMEMFNYDDKLFKNICQRGE